MKAESFMTLFASLVTALCIVAAGATAQGTAGAVSQTITPNARAQGMGRAFTAVAEGPSTGWWNPGGYGMPQPPSFSPISQAQLIPDLADDVWFRAFGATIQLGRLGIGGGAHLSHLTYGETVATDEIGNVIVTDPWEYTALLGAAVDLARLAGRDRIHWGVGINVKRFHVDLGPSTDASSRGSAWDYDIGTVLTGRIPLEADDGPAGPSYVGARAGWVLKNAGGNTIEYLDQPDPLGTVDHLGVAVEGAFGRAPLFGHLVRLVLAAETQGRGHKVFPDEEPIDNYGAELSVMGTSVRMGWIDDPQGDVTDWTMGFGLGLDLYGIVGSRAGFAFDFASVPQASGLQRVHHVSTTFWPVP